MCTLRHTRRSLLAAALILGALVIVSCGQGDNATKPAAGSTMKVFDPPSTEFARAAGIMEGPVTAAQAKSIAERATQGTARSVEAEDEDGTNVFGVIVGTATGQQDVKVRISDGAVTRIESDDDGDDESRDDDEGPDDESD